MSDFGSIWRGIQGGASRNEVDRVQSSMSTTDLASPRRRFSRYNFQDRTLRLERCVLHVTHLWVYHAKVHDAEYAFMHNCIYIYMYTYTRLQSWCMHTHTHTHTHTRTHTYTDICTHHACTHTQTLTPHTNTHTHTDRWRTCSSFMYMHVCVTFDGAKLSIVLPFP